MGVLSFRRVPDGWGRAKVRDTHPKKHLPSMSSVALASGDYKEIRFITLHSTAYAETHPNNA